VKILKEIIKLRKQDQDERDEHESLLDVYMRAMDEAGPAQVAEAAFFTLPRDAGRPSALRSSDCLVAVRR
jgi:hypothetical protein